MTTDYSFDQLCEELSLSDEMQERLRLYGELLEKWQKRINLVGPRTLTDKWQRHFLDSAQLITMLPEQQESLTIVDMGSGSGFPGLILAALSKANVHLIESDSRKGAFLREVNRAMEAGAEIYTMRLESAAHEIGPIGDIVSARALASLDKLLKLGIPLLKKDGFCLFLKGEKVHDELIESRENWTFRQEMIQSRSDPSGVILKIWDISAA